MKITTWRQLSYNNTTFIPILFFIPDFEIKMFTSQNGFLNVPLLISGTGGIYDGFYFTTINEATSLGGCPVDFDDAPVFWSATLTNTSFTIYPPTPGVATLFNLPPAMASKDAPEQTAQTTKEPFEAPIIQEEGVIEPAPPQENNRSNTFIYIICFFLIVIILIIACFYRCIKP